MQIFFYWLPLVFVVEWVVLLLAVVLVFRAIAARARRGTLTTAESMNRLLFAIVIMLFAIVFKLAFVSSGTDFVVLVIGLAGLGVGWYGISAGPRE